MNDQIVEYIVALRNKLADTERELDEYRDKNVELCSCVQELKENVQELKENTRVLKEMLKRITKKYYELLEEVC